ncbi:MAG: hypothetical protein QUT30_15690 [Acidobacteriota bacterium]|nr:hypothetical protein [Acidobacteriota bacterium]
MANILSVITGMVHAQPLGASPLTKDGFYSEINCRGEKFQPLQDHAYQAPDARLKRIKLFGLQALAL